MNANQKPPQGIRLLFRSLQKQTYQQLLDSAEIFDFKALNKGQLGKLQKQDFSSEAGLHSIFADFVEKPANANDSWASTHSSSVQRYRYLRVHQDEMDGSWLM